MRIGEVHSILGGLEHILVHKRAMWEEVQEAISSARAQSPDPGALLRQELLQRGWHRSETTCWVSPDSGLILRTIRRSPDGPIRDVGDLTPIPARYVTELLRERVAIDLEFDGKGSATSELFDRYLAFYVGDVIDAGVEILPMKELSENMSSGFAYYERELYNVIRQGRGSPAVPLVLIGVAA